LLATVDRGSGPPVILLHGQPGTHASWDPVVGLLEPSLRLLVPDRVGYGATAGEARGVAANAELVARLIDARDAGPATVVAHSWSGAVAVLLADAHHDLVSALVLVGAACTPDSLDVVDRALNVAVVGDVLTVAGLVSFGEVLPRLRRLIRYAPARYRDQLSTAFPDHSLLGGERGTLGRHRRTFLIEQRALIAELPAVTAALARVRVPTAVVVGEWDLVVRPESARTLARSVPGAELITVPRAGHFVARDAPELLAEVIIRYGRRPVRGDAVG